MKNKNIAIVTGGAGFIGSHMVDDLIARDYKVYVIDNFIGGHEKNLQQHKNNINLMVENLDINKVDKIKNIFKNAKFVFHFAGLGDIVPSIEKPLEYFQTNVQGTIKLLDIANNFNVKKFIYAASSSCYGLAKTPTKENHPINPLYPYALSKYMGEQALFHWNNVYNMKVNSMRIFNAYGPRVRTAGAYGAVFGVFFKQKLSNKPFTIVGNGKQKRDFIYVSDVTEAFLKIAESENSNQIFNLGSGNPQTINKLANIIGGKIEYIPKRPGEPNITYADITKIKNSIPWKPKINFTSGVKKMIEGINNWKDAPLWTPKLIDNATKSWFKYLSNKYDT